MTTFDESSRLLGENQEGAFGDTEISADSMTILELQGEIETVVLREWTAQDFSRAYVRLRPHLEKHASRFLRDPSQVEEVVQDAFLYLMTALPELESEIGVLRFLKWKTKMLALDLIRLNARYSVTPFEDYEHHLAESNHEDLSLELERADDSAVVSLALAKLSPRQRKVIVETQLLEKPLETVAQDMGLSNNALRQLLHRARAAFKLALVGEADVSGLSASVILSLAAKKAARESGKLVAGASAFLLAIAGVASIGLASLDFQQTASVLRPPGERSLLVPSQNPTQPEQSMTGAEKSVPEPDEIVVASRLEASNSSKSTGLEPGQDLPAGPPDVSSAIPASPDESAEALAAGVEEFLTVIDFASDAGFAVKGDSDHLLVGRDGLSASFGIDGQAESPVQFVYLTIQLPVGEVIAVPTNGLAVWEEADGQSVLHYAATDFIVGDFSGAFGNAASTSTSFVNSSLLVSFEISEHREVRVIDFDFQSRSQS